MSYYASLIKQHQEILDLLNTLPTDLNKDKAALQAKSLHNWQLELAALLNKHLLLEDDYMYPVLQNHTDIRIRSMAKEYAKEMGDLKKAFSDYLSKWGSSDKIADSPGAFADETDSIVVALVNRIRREDERLFPFISETMKDSTPSSKKRSDSGTGPFSWIINTMKSLVRRDY